MNNVGFFQENLLVLNLALVVVVVGAVLVIIPLVVVVAVVAIIPLVVVAVVVIIPLVVAILVVVPLVVVVLVVSRVVTATVVVVVEVRLNRLRFLIAHLLKLVVVGVVVSPCLWINIISSIKTEDLKQKR